MVYICFSVLKIDVNQSVERNTYFFSLGHLTIDYQHHSPLKKKKRFLKIHLEMYNVNQSFFVHTLKDTKLDTENFKL